MTRRDAKIAARRIARVGWVVRAYVRPPLPEREACEMRRPWRGYSVGVYLGAGVYLHATSRTMRGRSRAALLSALGVRVSPVVPPRPCDPCT